MQHVTGCLSSAEEECPDLPRSCHIVFPDLETTNTTSPRSDSSTGDLFIQTHNNYNYNYSGFYSNSSNYNFSSFSSSSTSNLITMNRCTLMLVLLGLCAVSLAATTPTEKSPYCAHNNCQNGGTCRLKGDGTEFCTCHDNYYGTLCQDYNCAGRYCRQMKCQNGGTCLEVLPYDDGNESFHCLCTPGFTGQFCHTPVKEE